MNTLRCLMVFSLMMACAHADGPALRFFIVSPDPAPGLHLIDSPKFPKLGYISDKPDLVITKLKSMEVSKTTERSVMHHQDGTSDTSVRKDIPTLSVTLQPDDAKAFAQLTTAGIGKQILMMLDDEQLMAPMVDEPIPGGAFNISGGNKQADFEADVTKLKKMETH